MSASPAIVYPLILSATSAIVDAQQAVQRAFDLNATAMTRGDVLPVEWVLVRRTVGFEVEWYFTSVHKARVFLQTSSGNTRVLWNALGLQDRDKLEVLQLSALTDDRATAAVVLAGNRVVGMIAPTKPTAARTRFAEVMEPVAVGAVPTAAKQSVSLSGGRAGASAVDRPLMPPAMSKSLTPISPAKAAPQAVEASAYVNAPRKTQPGKPFTMRIGLAESPSDGVSGGKIVVAFPADTKSIDVKVHLESAGFTCAKGFDHTLTVSANDPFTPRIVLSLVATPLPDGVDEELRAVQLLYSYGGTTCGTATYTILVQRTNVDVVIPQPASNAPRVSISHDAPAIDLTLCIAWQDDNEATHTLRWSFTSPHEIAPPVGKMSRSSIDLASLPISILDEITKGDGQPDIDLLVGGIGKSIADEIPVGVWEVLSNARKAVQDKRGADALPTVLLSTQETRVPWELALVPDEHVDESSAPFLSTQFIVTRWLLDDNVRSIPPYEATSPDVVAVYGDYSKAVSAAELPFAAKEAEFLTSLNGTSFTASRTNVINILEDKAAHADGTPLIPGVVHFAGHGESARSNTAASFLILNDDTTLSMTYFLNAPSLKKHHPLVFLNACQLGAATTTLGQPGGFASFCVRAGCSAVIAPLWSVNDDVAYDVTKEFYSDVLGHSGSTPLSIAHAMYNTRKIPFTDIPTTNASGSVTTARTATRLAYIVYGHPAFHPLSVSPLHA